MTFRAAAQAVAEARGSMPAFEFVGEIKTLRRKDEGSMRAGRHNWMMEADKLMLNMVKSRTEYEKKTYICNIYILKILFIMKKILSLVAAVIMFGSTAMAQAIPETKEAVEIPQSATMLQVAGQLAKYGYAEGEALPLIQAAEIFQNFQGKALNTEVTHEGEATGQKDSKVSFDPAKLLADATVMADGDATLLALIKNVQDSATRGAVGDYEATTTTVAAQGTDIYKIRFRGGEQAIVIVSGDGDTDLDVFVYDSNGNLVASDTDNTDDCVCVWTPRYTGTFTIKVKNYGRVYNRYVIAVN